MILFLLKGYPRLSETFIAQEIRGLELAGIPIAIVSLRRPTDAKRHPIHGEIAAPVSYLPEYLYQEPLRLLRAWRRARKLPGYKRAFRQWRKDLRRDPTANRGRRFGQACILAAELPANARRLHAHFLHTPAAVAYYAHLMTGLPWSASAHAKDIWTSPEWEKREKLAALDWLVTCTGAGAAHLRDLAPAPETVSLLYHGLDFARFPPPEEPPVRNGGGVNLLSVGRLVPKKGYATLLRALALLPRDLDWRFRHVGGGPLAAALRTLARELGLAERIDWLGAQDQQRVLEEYRGADVFLLAAEIAADGDRDGLPNVLMEAQSQGLPCLATAVSGIPELIRDGETGLLAPPGDPETFAAALARLILDADLRRRLGAAGSACVREHFSAAAGIAELARRFRRDLAP